MNVVAVCIHATQTQHAQTQMEITLVLVKMALQEMEHFAQVKNLNNFKTSFLETILKIYCNSKLSARQFSRNSLFPVLFKTNKLH